MKVPLRVVMWESVLALMLAAVMGFLTANMRVVQKVVVMGMCLAEPSARMKAAWMGESWAELKAEQMAV